MSQVAARLKRSEAWLSNLLNLVMLPATVQAGVANGQVPVTAALEIGKLPNDQQVAVFDELAHGGEKITAAKVREKRRAIQDGKDKSKTGEDKTSDDEGKSSEGGVKSKGKAKGEKRSASVASVPVPASIPRTLKQLKTFLESKTGPEDYGRVFADRLLDFLGGRSSEDDMNVCWDFTFASLEDEPR